MTRRRLHRALTKIYISIFLIIALIAYGQSAKAQDCIPDTGPGAELPAQHSGVIPPGQVEVDISWTPPLFTSECDLLDSDPALAIVRYEVYVSHEPGTPASPPTVSVPADTLAVTQPVQTQGNRMWVMLRACNDPRGDAGDDFCGYWSEQIEKVVAGKPRQMQINVTVRPGS